MRVSDSPTTRTASSAVTTAQNARVISSFRSLRAGCEVEPGRLGLGARRPLERVGAAARVDRPLQVEPRAEVVGDVGVDDAAAAASATGMPNSSTWFVRV